MAEKYFTLPCGVEVSRSLLDKTYAELLLLEAEGKSVDSTYFHFWELVYKARHPRYKISADGVTDLFDRHLLDNDGRLHYLTQLLVLYMVKVVGNKVTVISWDELKKLLS